jgi:ABC-type multidrug transport system fused ATPase/permease subunit
MPELAARGEARVSADLRRQWDIEAAQQRQSSGSEGDDKSAPRAVDARPGAAAEGAMAIGDFDRMPEHRRVTLEVRGVSAQVPALFGQPTLAARLAPARLRRKVSSAGGGDRGTAHEGGGAGDRVMNTILFDVWARVCPGEVLALMGPSGSGKTTLLSIMGGRAAKGMRTRGEVLFNGLPLTKRVKRRVGFVQQDDLLYEVSLAASLVGQSMRKTS